MTKSQKHYIISTGRNHEYLFEMRLRIFLPAAWKVSTELKPTNKDPFFRNDYKASKASVQDASSRKSSLPLLAPPRGFFWVFSMLFVILSFDLCLSVSVRGLGGLENRSPPAGQACGA